MGQELIAELNRFEVDVTSAGNMRVDVRSKDHHGDLVIATPRPWDSVPAPAKGREGGGGPGVAVHSRITIEPVIGTTRSVATER